MKLLAVLLCAGVSCYAFSQTTDSYKELYRPRFHFSPKENWCNDPNGLVYHNGEYHLFYQHNPYGNVWGHMSWAHAVSKDLINWKHLPLAIPEENGMMIFSGTCVVDNKNTSGFANKPGQVPMIAVYTSHIENVNQSQHIAFSLDNGITWTKYDKNPVLDLHKKDFRDPKVFWYEPKQYWVMAVMLPVDHIVQFYSSKNLKEWNHLSDFGPAADTTGVWECPDLTQVPVAGNPKQKKWVLQTSQNASMQYFVGEFDGIKFINENPADEIFRPDYGPDYYAAIAYNHLPAGHFPAAIGWINNWNYANDIPTARWKGAMSLPRTMSVKKVNKGWILIQQPVAGIRSLRRNLFLHLKNETFNTKKLFSAKSQQYELDITYLPEPETISGVKLAAGNGHEIEIGYNCITQTFYIDRSKTNNQSFNKIFEKLSRYETKLVLTDDSLRLNIFFDHSIVEVFVNGGEAVLTALIFPRKEEDGIELFTRGGSSKVVSLKLWNLKSVW